MRGLFVALLVAHGLIHLVGFAKAFGFAELPQLTQPIANVMGVLWLVAAIGLLATAVLFVKAPRIWWATGLAAVVVSQVVIVSAWGDAKLGSIGNALVLVGVAYGFAAQGPFSLRAEYRREVGRRVARAGSAPLVAEADLASLPEPVRRYVRLSGAVGRPRVHHVKAVWRGRIRAGAGDPWMSFTAEQVNFLDEPARFFFMDARKGGLPVDVLHAFTADGATMRVRLLSIWPLVTAAGPEVRRAETVTVFNDLCILAPAALTSPAIRWEPVDGHSVRTFYTVGSHTISAVLRFNAAGELVDFDSEDRLASSPDGKQLTRQRWSTPVSAYRQLGDRRVATRGEGRWHPPEGEFGYLELELVDLEVNGGR